MDADRQSPRRRFVPPRQRDAAGAHFRRLEAWAIAGKTPPASDMTASPAAEQATPASGRFEIYRMDEVRVTATRFSGGDWHWRLSDASGTCLVDAGGYPSEGECRKAVVLLRCEAALAAMPGRE